MVSQTLNPHLARPDWLTTPDGNPRGSIEPSSLKELWFHTGTICNLSCPFCLEGSKPGDDRLNKLTLEDVKPFMNEALILGVEKFSFTGGEPFVIKDMVAILDHALNLKPCLVLTNATEPLRARLKGIESLRSKPHTLSFRVSIDYPDAQKHDAGRGRGNFSKSWDTIRQLSRMGFAVSIARQRDKSEKTPEDIRRGDIPYLKHIVANGLPRDTRIVSFPNLFTPGSEVRVPFITENCMTTYHSMESRGKFMCAFSKMVVKRNGRMRVYACTLVDDDSDYDLGGNLADAMAFRVMMKHHRCYSCFSQGASCSEG